MSTKRQPEIPGTERPTHNILDEVFAPFLDARDEAKASRKAVKDARENATERMLAIADKLEKDDHGNPCYVYRDGAREVALKLVTSTKLVVENLLDSNDADEDIG